MANREELAIIRNARAGQAAAQLALGKLYLFGSAGLPQSLPTALYWLEKAARQECQQAWQLIGDHIPLELAQGSAPALASWYERAYDDGSVHAGLVYAQLVLDPAGPGPGAQHAKAQRALEDAARAGFPAAQWLLARRRELSATPAPARAARPESAAPATSSTLSASSTAGAPAASQAWLRRAADNGVAEAQAAVLEQAWETGHWEDYLVRALPLARALVAAASSRGQLQRLAPGDITLLSRVARLLDARHGPAPAPGEPLCFWELAAAEHDRHAQLAMGLRCARMGIDGRRIAGGGGGAANFKKAIRWLTLAGEQGLPEAWYALSRIYIKPEFSQRNVADAQRYLERAAEMGYADAQLECGNNAWRARRENENNDVRAAYWLQKAAAQGSGAAAALLRKIAPRLSTPPYLETGILFASYQAVQRNRPRDAAPAHPLLAARLELAALFNLSRAEALLLDVPVADQGHCLVIDIRASYGRSKRRLVLVETAQERIALDRIGRLFEQIDCGPSGPEGNYRQRLYRLRTLLGASVKIDEEGEAGTEIGLAA
ncbi:tetratricopeptide repeat protein [uncultured Massilia sp.]|uniref:tetratricopeptide repeat protein n=1 Tax=uncultured Massilia sp. TaxID=169973 RepID=UPI0025880E5D|nr:hypothetical protein [uncultured Massilia sp.]